MSTTPTITEQTVDVWGGRLAITVKVAGAGAPLLYLHPAAGLAWDPFLSHLASRYTVYAPEFPGTSEGNPYAIHTIDTLSDMVLAYEELVRTLGLDHPVVIGQSFGGMLAAELAATFPTLPDKLVLLDPIGLWTETAPVANWIATPPTSYRPCCSTTRRARPPRRCSHPPTTSPSSRPRPRRWCGRSAAPASSPGPSPTAACGTACTASPHPR
ncbi:alpha/beta fold hydrolase [Rhodococcus aetherivorans]